MFLEKFANDPIEREKYRQALEKLVSEYLVVDGPVEREDFRADNFELVPEIDRLVGTPFLRQDSNGRYMPGLAALVVVESAEAKTILRDIETILVELRAQYKDRPRRKDQRKLPELASKLKLDIDQVFRCFDFLGQESWAWASGSLVDRRELERSYVQPGERILQYKAMSDLFEALEAHIATAAQSRVLPVRVQPRTTTLRTSLDSYLLGAKIGEGGCATVYEARSMSSGDLVALKILKADAVNTQRLKRFRNELMFCMTMKHTHIVTVLDHGITEQSDVGLPFFVMPRIDSTLRALINGGAQPETNLGLFAQILDGLQAAHQRGVIHRDLKPENVLYDHAANRLLVADFGIAHFTEEDLYTAVETRFNERLANYRYAAPEQKERSAAVGVEADIYALGLMLNELFTRVVPQGTRFRTIGSVSESYSFLDPIVDRMVRNDPAERYRSVEEVLAAIEGAAGGPQGIALDKPPSTRPLENTKATVTTQTRQPPVRGPEFDIPYSWFDQQAENATGKLRSQSLRGAMEIRCSPSAHVFNATQRDLLTAVKQSQIDTFGWPIGLLLEGDGDGRPRVSADGIFAEIRRDQHLSFDYWFARRDGVFYLLQSLFEEQKEFQDGAHKVFFNTRIVRVTEALLFLSKLYTNLGIDERTTLKVEIVHSGLSERWLSAVGTRMVRGRHHSMADRVATRVEDTSVGLKNNVASHVQKVCGELFVLFDFFELGDSVYEDIVTNFLNGRCT